jgi:hypothetical protein
MEINRALLSNDFLPTAPQAPPNTGSTELLPPDDPLSTHQRFGPPILDNWLPDSGATCHYTPVFSDLYNVEACHIPVSLADGTRKISTFKGTTDCYFTTDEGQKSILGLQDVYFVEGLSHRLLSLTTVSASQNFTIIIKNCATTILFPDDLTYTWPLLQHELPTQHAFSTMAQPENTSPCETTFSSTFEEHVDTSYSDNSARPTTSQPLETRSHQLAHQIVRNLLTGSLHCAWNAHILSPALDKNTWPSCISISQEHADSKISLSQGSGCLHQLHHDIMSNPLRFKFTYKKFPENSASWLLDSSPDHPQRIVITRDAYFDKDMTSSAHVFNSKPSARAIPFNSHLDPNGLQPSDNSQPSIVRQTGSAVNLGNLPSIFIEEPKDSEQPLKEENNGSASSLPDTDNDPHNSDDKTDPITDNDIYLGPTPPTPQMINLTNHQKRHTSLKKEMTIYFQECSEPPPSVDPVHTAMLTIDTTAFHQPILPLMTQ